MQWKYLLRLLQHTSGMMERKALFLARRLFFYISDRNPEGKSRKSSRKVRVIKVYCRTIWTKILLRKKQLNCLFILGSTEGMGGVSPVLNLSMLLRRSLLETKKKRKIFSFRTTWSAFRHLPFGVLSADSKSWTFKDDIFDGKLKLNEICDTLLGWTWNKPFVLERRDGRIVSSALKTSRACLLYRKDNKTLWGNLHLLNVCCT